ncbi:MAG: tyrosine-type recombinase/integrase [Defluviitaleaceae bacterium]|nr:tyrosine-type recombinase/integrase [Defluviitaleaceae bacterium]
MFEEFQQSNKVRDLSEHTITSYQATYRAFIESYDEENLCDSLCIQVVNNFILHLKEKRNVNNISINTHLTNIRAFINYCGRLGYMEAFKIPSLRAEKKVKETYTDSELIILLKKPDVKRCSFVEYRNWVFTNYVVGTGNRVSTVVNIKISDLDLDNDTIILKKTKNKNQQIIPISNSLKIVLLDYLKYRKGAENDYLFCTAMRTTNDS